ncbi:MAG: DUF58 domain-containing protein [Lentisphaerae bacterium]|jgi:uncharacterized protein (DUF58 family)|nr:DUF58 domain-containing protein [Lentisphaerota bacterium]MBT4822720.1 DUF58 domain-containing protein [Lentisphaerota bacterium]MBT5604598.1 DUF58 domain-containing protein [Lentisphaerota bacterium]MBT7062199.1 DUF58 domain-containing protein [Lentisphaerota bacterium]MBT7845620.1 DUF58 domain-containing protein [Lentisphaerota bacterium]
MMTLRHRLKRWQDLFYAGPRFLGVDPIRRNGYQSPTLTGALWIYALIVRHFTLAGRITIISAGLIIVYAMFSLIMPIHLLAFAIIMLFVVDFLAGYLVFVPIRVRREAPERVGVGTEEEVRYIVANPSPRPALDMTLDALPYPSAVSLAQGRAFLKELPSGGRTELKATITARRRGRFTLPAVRADSAFPFNLWRWGSTGNGPQNLIVYPEFTPLLSLDLPTGLRYHSGGVALSSHTGESMDFLGCREFRDGDDPRRIHWRSWARTSFPVVKEFREEYLCRTAMVIDTYRPRPPLIHLHWAHPEDPILEGALSLVAAIADHLSDKDYIVDLFAAGPQVYRFQGGRSLAYLENILDILACLQPHHGEPLAEFSAELIEEIARISSAILVLLTWNDMRRDIIERLSANGVTVRAYLVTDGNRLPDDLPTSVTPVSAEDIRQGRCLVL